MKKIKVICDKIASKLNEYKSSIFHQHRFNTIEIPTSNEKGEIWIQECKCGNKQRVLFDNKGRCRDIKPL